MACDAGAVTHSRPGRSEERAACIVDIDSRKVCNCRSEIFPHYLNLLSDQDADVRGPACSALPAVCQHLDSSALTQMVRPKLLELAKDSSDLVRELLADHLIKLAPVLGKQQTIDLLLDPLLALLRDRTAEVPPPSWHDQGLFSDKLSSISSICRCTQPCVVCFASLTGAALLEHTRCCAGPLPWVGSCT